MVKYAQYVRYIKVNKADLHNKKGKGLFFSLKAMITEIWALTKT